MRAVQIPACPVSDTTTPFAGSTSEMALQIRSGRIGTASELRMAAFSARQSATICCTRFTD